MSEYEQQEKPSGLRFCPSPLWWRENLKVKNADIVRAEQVECESFGIRYSKYAAVMADGRDIICARVSDILRDAIGFGEAMLQWGVNETLAFLRERLQPWEVMSPADIHDLLTEAEKARFRTRDEAAEYGQRAHELIELWCHNGNLQTMVDGELCEIRIEDESEPVQRAFYAFRKFWDLEGLQPVAIEEWLVDVEAGYGGTLDLVARDKNGRLVLIDWKTSKAFRDKYLLQCGLYDLLWSTKNDPLSRAYICRIDKHSAEYQLMPVFLDEHERDNLRRQCQATLATYRWLRSARNILKRYNKEA